MFLKISATLRNEFRAWCDARDIVCEYMGSEYASPGYTRWDSWYIDRTEDALLAKMRWL
jgi:uncharacterized protein YecT (DUF1311 family)